MREIVAGVHDRHVVRQVSDPVRREYHVEHQGVPSMRRDWHPQEQQQIRKRGAGKRTCRGKPSLFLFVCSLVMHFGC